MGAAAQAMLADAYEAFSIEPPKRPFEILADDDSPHTLPLGNGTVGVADEKLARAIAESG